MDDVQLAAFLDARCGKLTASRMKDAMDFKKNGEPSEARSRYMRELLAERLTNSSIRHYVNDAMQWGLEVEAEAKQAYEVSSGNIITPCGTFDHPRIDMFAATPDGMLAHDGLCEFKCPTTATYVAWRLAGVVPDEHKPQMLAQLACTGRKWVEFVAYDPRIKGDLSVRLFVRRYEPVAEEVAAVEQAAEKFLEELDAMFELFTNQEAA